MDQHILSYRVKNKNQKQKEFELIGNIEIYSDYDECGCCIETKYTEKLFNCLKNMTKTIKAPLIFQRCLINI